MIAGGRWFYYRHSRGVTFVHVGVGLRLEPEGPAVQLVEEGLRPPLEGVPTLRLRGGEGVKSLESLTQVYRFLMEAGADRGTALVAVGGGALLDLAVFAAGTYMRGIGLVLVPTTLLAMVDAAIGGKGAVDWGDVKNLVGVFHQPQAVACDVSWAAGLPERAYRSALAEVVKYGISLNEGLYGWLRANVGAVLARDPGALEELVWMSAREKARVVELDEFEERGIRNVLNVGHTVGHALERVLGLMHGEAVAVGIAAELRLAVELGYLRESVAAEVEGLLSSLGLPTRVKAGEAELERARSLLRFDKKRRGDRVYMPLVVGLGRWVLERVPLEALERAVGYAVHRA